VTLSAVTFDATHTLFHAPRMAAIYSEVLTRHGMQIGPSVLRPLLRDVWQELSCSADPRHDRFAAHPQARAGFWRRFLERLCERLEVPPVSPFAARELYERFARADAWAVYPDVVPALQELRRRGLRLAVVSNWDERLPRLLLALDLAGYFDAIVFSQEAGVEKTESRDLPPGARTARRRGAACRPRRRQRAGGRRRSRGGRHARLSPAARGGAPAKRAPGAIRGHRRARRAAVVASSRTLEK
jgi:putative hydrolase of the HAD superfamily